MPQNEWENLASLLSLAAGVVAAILFLGRIIPAAATASVDRAFRACASHTILCAVSLAMLSLAVNLAITLHNGVPQPRIHDEFSYLLAADTFAHGRITNPTPPGWDHFETPQQLMRPTYMSKYPPGQGIALAMGQRLFGQPITGEWLANAAAVAAIYWMLLGFVPRNWALLGGIVAALHPQMLDWSQVYWGGCVAALGGALLIGAWGRLMAIAVCISSWRRSCSCDACVASSLDLRSRATQASPLQAYAKRSCPTRMASTILAAGLIILAITRPFEGFVFCIPLIIALILRHRNQFWLIAMQAALPLLLAAAAMGYYNFRITGHAFDIPYLEYAAQYEIYPKLWFLSPHPKPPGQNPAMEFVHRYFEHDAWAGFHTINGAWLQSQYRFELLFTTHVKLAVLLLPLLVAIFTQMEKRIAWLACSAAVCVTATWTEIFVFPHYEAPLLPAILLIIIVGWRKLARWKWRELPLGQVLAKAVAIGFLTGAGMSAMQPFYHDPDLLDQQSVVNQLPQLHSGRHLVFVSYAPMHSYHVELVHNLSDLNQSRIIWARSFGPQSDRSLIASFPERQIWSLNVGGKLDLQPYLQASH